MTSKRKRWLTAFHLDAESEVVRLRAGDIDSEQKIIRIVRRRAAAPANGCDADQ